jgi:hypothetical protein
MKLIAIATVLAALLFGAPAAHADTSQEQQLLDLERSQGLPVGTDLIHIRTAAYGMCSMLEGGSGVETVTRLAMIGASGDDNGATPAQFRQAVLDAQSIYCPDTVGKKANPTGS